MNGKRNGKGKEYNKYGTIIYKGGYLKGKKSGKGKEYNRQGGLMYEGEFLDGKRNGQGIEYNIFGSLKFEGEYLNGKKWNGKETNYYGRNFDIVKGEKSESPLPFCIII